MLTKQDIKSFKILAKTLNVIRDEIRHLDLLNMDVKTKSYSVISKENLDNIDTAKSIAKSIGVDLAIVKNIGKKIPTLSSSDIEENNFFIVIYETAIGNLLAAIWSKR